MGNKYQEAVGRWEHTIGKVTHILEPEEDDNYKFLRAKGRAEKSSNGDSLFKDVGTIYYDMVVRSEGWKAEASAMGEDEIANEIVGLKKWIGLNIRQIIEDFLIAFRWVTREKLDEAQKKLSPPSPEKVE